MKRLIDNSVTLALCGATMLAASAQNTPAPPPLAPAGNPLSVTVRPVQVETVEVDDKTPGGFGRGGSRYGPTEGGGYGGGLINSSSGRRSAGAIGQNNRGRAPEVSVRLNEVVAFDNKRANSPLIIRTGKIDGKTTDELREDLAVMTHLIDKAAEENADSFHARAAGIDILTLAGGGRPARTLYLQDYGAIFTLNVAMPLKGDAPAEQEEQAEPARNEEWEEARNELYGRKRRAGRAHGHPFQREFDQGNVDELKSALVNSLKSAVNIRHLKPEDCITIVVRGGSGPADPTRGVVYADAFASGAASTEDSMMVLRVKKAELDKALENSEAPDLEKIVSVAIY